MTDLPKPVVTPGGGSTDSEAAYEAVLAIAQRMHRGHHWAQGPDKTMRCVKAPLTKTMVRLHVDQGRPIGLCPIVPGESIVMAACLDFDSHKGEVGWNSMVVTAKQVADAAAERGLIAVPFRSTGGSGIHLIFLWGSPQDAYTVRQTLEGVLAQCFYASGTKGVANREIEVFPKQDAVPEGGFGSMWVLPLSRKSVPLNAETFEEMALPYLALSAGLATQPKPERLPKTGSSLPESGSMATAVEALPAVEYDYDLWRDIVFAIHDGDSSDAGLVLAQRYNDEKHQHERGPDWLPNEVWPHIKDNGDERITVATLFHHARKAGWTETNTDGFESVEGANSDTSAATDGFKSAADADTTGAPSTTPTYEDFTTLDLIPPEPRDWIINDWLAAGHVHALFAKGGAGKSLLAQQLATAVATNDKWLDMSIIKGGPVVGYFCEEDGNELRWRQHRINKRGEIEAMALTQLYLQARLGEQSNVMMLFDNERKAKITMFYRLVRDEVARLRPRLLILDNAAQLFAGVENDRAHVTQFANALARIARGNRCAVLLLGHTAKSDESTYSGSTAWENVARVRWFLNMKNDGTSDLSVEKSNIGPRTKIAVNWQDHVFVRFDRATEASNITVAARDMVLTAVREITTAGPEDSEARGLSTSRTQATYAPKVIRTRGLHGGLDLDVLEAAILALIGTGSLSAEAPIGRRKNRQVRTGLGLTDQGNQELSNKLLIGNDSADLA